jgi:hypothetical protein
MIRHRHTITRTDALRALLSVPDDDTFCHTDETAAAARARFPDLVVQAGDSRRQVVRRPGHDRADPTKTDVRAPRQVQTVRLQ